MRHLQIPSLPVPNPRQLMMLVAVALSVGVVVGSAINPGGVAAGPARLLLAGGDEAPAKAAAGKQDSAGSSVALGAPVGSSPAQQAPAADAPLPPPPAPPAPAPATALDPVPEPSVPLDDVPLPASPDDTAGQPDEGSELAPFKGAVVQVNQAAHGYALATAEGDVIAVHARRLPAIGDQLSIEARQLANGTSSEADRELTGSRRTAKVRGTVTFVDDEQRSYVISVRGASILVARADEGSVLPAVRDLVTASVALEEVEAPVGSTAGRSTRLRETSLQIEGRASGPVEIQGRIERVATRARRLMVSADGVGASDRQIELLVPRDLDIGPLKRGRVIAATVDIAKDGNYSLTGVSQDSDATAADDEEGLQGDQAPN